MNSILSIKNLSITYNGTSVVRNVSLDLHAGEILGLVGESGSGKSTIIKAAMGLLDPGGRVTDGNIYYRGTDLLTLKEKEMRQIRGTKLGMIFQDASGTLCPIRTIGDQIIESLKAHGKVDKAQAKSQAIELFDKLNFRDPEKVWKSYPFELSGGMNQRVSVALTMLMKPEILLSDEATSALDNISRNQVIMELIKLYDMGTSVIFVTHDIDIVDAICDTVLVLKNGEIQEYGRAKEVLNSPKSDYTKHLIRCTRELRNKAPMVSCGQIQ
ncbi:MAG: ABC transporter ATP-binding protein [Pseudobutyrivibrio sp.]|nr:ABC transporter ATP-binding protein [Pseudobutyrivibrio sp.]